MKNAALLILQYLKYAIDPEVSQGGSHERDRQNTDGHGTILCQ